MGNGPGSSNGRTSPFEGFNLGSNPSPGIMKYKKCSKCQQYKQVKYFNKRRKGYSAYCKLCNRANLKAHYKNNPQYYHNKRRTHKKHVKELIRNSKLRPCVDCGQRFHPCAMQYDHIPGTNKRFNISGAITALPVGTVLTEIDKCDLVCAVCHAYRTYYRLTGKDPQTELQTLLSA